MKTNFIYIFKFYFGIDLLFIFSLFPFLIFFFLIKCHASYKEPTGEQIDLSVLWPFSFREKENKSPGEMNRILIFNIT